jgi:hypothetical protein
MSGKLVKHIRSCRARNDLPSLVPLCGDGLVSVVSLAVGEEVVDEHANDGKEEDDESPKDLVGDGTVRLEDLDYSTDASAYSLSNAILWAMQERIPRIWW